MVYAEWVKRKQAEMLSWQINKPGDHDDGGWPAEKPNDRGGVWTTSEALHTLLNYRILPPTDERVQKAKSWILRHRNSGGEFGEGWPLINKGKSFADTTAMATLALSFFSKDPEVLEAISKAKDWLLQNQNDDNGWGIWKHEDSLVSATSITLVALKEINAIFKEDRINLAIQNGVAWLKNIQNKNTHLWGFAKDSQETNIASTCQAVMALFNFGEDPEKYREALNLFMDELKNNNAWRTVEEIYTLKFFGQGLDQRLSWFIAPRIVCVLVDYARILPRDVGVRQIIDAIESLKKFDSEFHSKEVTDISIDRSDIRTWASAQYFIGLLQGQAYLQEHLDEYVSVMSGKITLIEKAGFLQSPPLILKIGKHRGIYISGRFLVGLFPAVGISLVGIAFLTYFVNVEVALMTSLFGLYLLTFVVLLLGFRQNVVSRHRFSYIYFPIWALIVLSTGLFYFGKTTEGLVVLLLIGFPEILSHVMRMGKPKDQE